MIAALLHLVAQLAAGWLAVFGHPAPAPAVLEQPAPVEAPAAVAPPVLEQEVPPVLAQPGPADMPPVDPGCLPGEELQGELGCVAVQLPGETDGRSYG